MTNHDRRARDREYYLAHRESIREKQRQYSKSYRERNKERIRQRDREYYARNRERIRRQQCGYYRKRYWTPGYISWRMRQYGRLLQCRMERDRARMAALKVMLSELNLTVTPKP
jgi:hypothetical protein